MIDIKISTDNPRELEIARILRAFILSCIDESLPLKLVDIKYTRLDFMVTNSDFEEIDEACLENPVKVTCNVTQ